jgi:hypothetical protein
MVECVLGRSDEEISRAVSTIVKRNAEYNKRRREEINAKASVAAAERQAVPTSTRGRWTGSMPRLRLGRGRAGLSGAPAFVSFPAPSAAAFSFAALATIDCSFPGQ